MCFWAPRLYPLVSIVTGWRQSQGLSRRNPWKDKLSFNIFGEILNSTDFQFSIGLLFESERCCTLSSLNGTQELLLKIWHYRCTSKRRVACCLMMTSFQVGCQELCGSVMWVKQCHKPPIFGNGLYHYLGMVYYCFITISQLNPTLYVIF